MNLGFVATPMTQQFGNNASKIWTSMANQIPEEEHKQTVLQMVTADQEIVAGSEMQTTDDISKLLQQVVLSPKPDFRIPTSNTATRMARERFVDPTGNSIIESWL